jgi:hypothetical protein
MVSKEYLSLLDDLTAKDLDHAWLDLIFSWQESDFVKVQKNLVNLASLGLGLLIQKRGYHLTTGTFEIVGELKTLHKNNNAGYSGDNPDPWSNFRAIESFGYAASVGCLTRLCDKFARYTILIENSDQDKVGESIEDTLMDFVAYCLILVCLLGE